MGTCFSFSLALLTATMNRLTFTLLVLFPAIVFSRLMPGTFEDTRGGDSSWQRDLKTDGQDSLEKRMDRFGRDTGTNGQEKRMDPFRARDTGTSDMSKNQFVE